MRNLVLESAQHPLLKLLLFSTLDPNPVIYGYLHFLKKESGKLLDSFFFI